MEASLHSSEAEHRNPEPGTRNPEPALRIEALSAGYGDAIVLRDFSLAVAAGEVAAIIGPNGCGKSTLLRCAAGLLAPRTGRIFVTGDDVTQLTARERARRIALLPQHYEGGQNLTGMEMALLGRTPHLPPYGQAARRDVEIAQRALEAANATQFADRRVGELSGGERQRVLLARALAQQPGVLLLDEPTSSLDIRYQHEVLDTVLRLARDSRLAVVLVLHQINLAAAVADHITLLADGGSTRAAGPPPAVMTQEHLEAVYGMPLRVTAHPLSGRPQAQSAWRFETALTVE
jgi:iron complex transport system ATP-binding protein